MDSGQLLHNLLVFGRVLRSLGLPVQPGVVKDCAAALAWIDIGHKEEFRNAARSLFVTRRDDLAVFEEAFEKFWSARGLGEPEIERRGSVSAGGLSNRSGSSMAQWELSEGVDSGQQGGQGGEAALTYSPHETLRRKDFGALSDSELEEARRLLLGLAWSLGEHWSRRWRPGTLQLVDFRRTFREGLKSEGEMLRLYRRQHKLKPRPLTVLADVSGSMERYTRMLLHFVVGLVHSLDQPVEVFVFSTRLTRVSHQLRHRDVERVLGEIARTVEDWSGGTRIGQALKSFNFEWARRVLGRRAVVLLISDGWDRGDLDILRREMARLQRSCHRLIWLNPLLGSPQYEPITLGMRTALPYVDDFLPVHNLASLEQLASILMRLDDRRQSRRQQRPALDLRPSASRVELSRAS